LEKIRELILAHVAGEFNVWIADTALLDRFDVSVRMGMIAPGNHQLCIGQTPLQSLESGNHKLQPLVRSPFSERKNAVLRIATAREVGELGTSSQSAV
jgi:hypothetical protein